MASTLPTFTTEPPEKYDVEADSAMVQSGQYKKPSFFGDNSLSSLNAMFQLGVNTALSYSGQTGRKNDLVDERSEESGYRLTKEEFKLLQRRANSIALYSQVPYDTCEDFLIILCFIDKLDDMVKIANAVQISELADEKILLNPYLILNLPNLEKVCFCAQALDGLVNMFRKYLSIAQTNVNKSNDGDDINSVLNSISSVLGGMGSIGNILDRIESGDMGNLLSELITGKRIPLNVIAKNPMLQSPSYIGKAFFGESHNSMANIDIDQLFNKSIANFPKMTAGAGTTAFTMQNYGSFSKSMPLVNLVAKIVTGSTDVSSQRKLNQVMGIVDTINSLTGSKTNDSVDVFRADNAIPIMTGISAALSGVGKPIISSSTFQDAWVSSQSVANMLNNIDPTFMETARKIL